MFCAASQDKSVPMILSSFIVCYVFSIFLLFLACLPLLMLMLTFIMISLNEGFNPGFILLDGIAYERVGIVIVYNYAVHLGTLYLMFLTILSFLKEVSHALFLGNLCSYVRWLNGKFPFQVVFLLYCRV